MNHITRSWKERAIRQREDGYMNLTDMCQSEGKLFGHWKENKDTKEYLEALSADIGIPISAQRKGVQPLIEIVKGGKPEEQGTWGHPDVALELARWLNKRFSIQCNRWVKELLTEGTVNLKEKQQKQFSNVYVTRLFFSADKIKIPANHWIIFDECGKLMRFLERNVEINKFDLVDGSVGKCWSNYRKQQAEKGADWLRDRVPYLHPFPDKRGSKECWAYHFQELMYFRMWFQGQYIPFHLWKYLNGKYPIDTVRQLEASHHQLILT